MSIYFSSCVQMQNILKQGALSLSGISKASLNETGKSRGQTSMLKKNNNTQTKDKIPH